MYVNSVAPNRRFGCRCRQVELNNLGGAKFFLRSDKQSRGQTTAYLFSHPEARCPIGKCLVPSPCTHRRSYYSPSSRLRSPNDLSHSRFPITILRFPIRVKCPFRLIIDFMNLITLGAEYKLRNFV